MPTSVNALPEYRPPRITVVEFRMERGFSASGPANLPLESLGTHSYSAASDGWGNNAFSTDEPASSPQYGNYE